MVEVRCSDITISGLDSNGSWLKLPCKLSSEHEVVVVNDSNIIMCCLLACYWCYYCYLDSKTLSEASREKYFEAINGSSYLGWIVEILSPNYISNLMLRRCVISLSLPCIIPSLLGLNTTWTVYLMIVLLVWLTSCYKGTSTSQRWPWRITDVITMLFRFMLILLGTLPSIKHCYRQSFPTSMSLYQPRQIVCFPLLVVPAYVLR